MYEIFNEDDRSKVIITMQHKGKEASAYFLMDFEQSRDDFDAALNRILKKFDKMYEEGYFDDND